MPRGLPFGPGWEGNGKSVYKARKLEMPGSWGGPERLSPPPLAAAELNEVATWEGLTLLLLVPKVRSCLAPELSALPILPLQQQEATQLLFTSSPSNKPGFLLAGFLEVERLC